MSGHMADYVDMRTYPTTTRGNAEWHMADKGHDLDDWILDQLDRGYAAQQMVAALWQLIHIGVSERTMRRWINHAKQQEEVTR